MVGLGVGMGGFRDQGVETGRFRSIPVFGIPSTDQRQTRACESGGTVFVFSFFRLCFTISKCRSLSHSCFCSTLDFCAILGEAVIDVLYRE